MKHDLSTTSGVQDWVALGDTGRNEHSVETAAYIANAVRLYNLVLREAAHGIGPSKTVATMCNGLLEQSKIKEADRAPA